MVLIEHFDFHTAKPSQQSLWTASGAVLQLRPEAAWSADWCSIMTATPCADSCSALLCALTRDREAEQGRQGSADVAERALRWQLRR